VVEAHLAALGIGKNQFKNTDELGSSDLGMVSYAYPTVNLNFKIAPDGTPGHSDALRDAANTDEGWKATVIAGKAVALSMYDMLTKPEKLKAVQESFKEAKGKEGK
jgi:aminobenzoyl-glutamate utilization protein B